MWSSFLSTASLAAPTVSPAVLPFWPVGLVQAHTDRLRWAQIDQQLAVDAQVLAPVALEMVLTLAQPATASPPVLWLLTGGSHSGKYHFSSMPAALRAASLKGGLSTPT